MERVSMSLDEIIAAKPRTPKVNKKKTESKKVVAVKSSKVQIKKPFDKERKVSTPNTDKHVVKVKTPFQNENSEKKSIFDRIGGVGGGAQHSGTAVIISNLNTDITAGDIASLCGRIGETKKVEILYDNITGASKGVAEVVFAKQSDAMNCVKQMHGLTIDLTPVSVKLASHSGKDHPNNNSLQGRVQGFGGDSNGKNVRVGVFGTASQDDVSFKVTMNGNSRKGDRIVKPFFEKKGDNKRDNKVKAVKKLNKNRPVREKNTPKSAEELDAEMEAYMSSK